MLSIPIHKDIGAYEPKIVAGMTSRTLVFTALALGTGAGLGSFVFFVLGQDPTEFPWVLLIMGASLGFWLLGYQRPLGLRFEEFASLWIRHRLFPQRLVYASSDALGRGCRYGMIARECHVWDGKAKPGERVQPAYARLRAEQGIELWDPGV